MQEINPIARPAGSKEPAPQQSKSPGSFTDVFEEFLSSETGAGGGAETGSETSASSVNPSAVAPVALKSSENPSALFSMTSAKGNPASLVLDSGQVSADELLASSQKSAARGASEVQTATGNGKPEPSTKATSQGAPDPILSAQFAPFNFAVPVNVIPLPSAVTAAQEKTPGLAPDCNRAVDLATSLIQPAGAVAVADTPAILPQGETAEPLQQNSNSGKNVSPGRPGPGFLKSAATTINTLLAAPDQLQVAPLFTAQSTGQHVAASARATGLVEVRPESESPAGDVATAKDSLPNDRRDSESLKLGDFDVTHFEYKTETETHMAPELQSAQMLQMMRTAMPARELKTVKLGPDSESLSQEANLNSSPLDAPAAIASPEAVRHVPLVFEAPPPPPVVRSVLMHIGDAESQVSVLIRERNGSLNVQLGSANEHLRENLQASGSLLMRELERNNPVGVTLDFTNFGSATEADSQSRPQSQAKKSLKSKADFADVVETAYLPTSSSSLNSL